jgi:hypothetical protein
MRGRAGCLRSRTCVCTAGGLAWPRPARSMTVRPVGNAVQRILSSEEQAILDLIEE